MDVRSQNRCHAVDHNLHPCPRIADYEVVVRPATRWELCKHCVDLLLSHSAVGVIRITPLPVHGGQGVRKE